MEDLVLYAIGAVVIVIFIIVLNHKKQKNTVNNFLKDAEQMQPMFLQQSVQKKLQSLYGSLYDEADKINGVETPEPSKRKTMLVQELEQLERDYSSKKITLKIYSDRLHALQMKANKL